MFKKAQRYLRFRLESIVTNAQRKNYIEQAFEEAKSKSGSTAAPGCRALLLPTASPGNLGDEALFIGTVKELNDMGFQRVCVISFSESELYAFQGADTVVLDLHHNPAGPAYLDFVKLASEFTHFIIWGADIVDGTHGIDVVTPRQVLANLAATIGLKTSICSFSISPNRTQRAMNGYRSLHPDVRLFCRDAFSLERLQEELPNGNPELSADLAFLLQPDHNARQSKQVHAWATRHKAAGKILFGLNINDLFCSYFDIPKELLLSAYAETIAEIQNTVPAFALIHLPHDTHPNKQLGGMTDFTLSRELNVLLPATIRDNAFIPDETLTAPEVRSICSQLDLVFSARMHLSIAALAVGTPVFGLAYQGKFEGLFRHFNLTDMYLEPDQILVKAKAVCFLLSAFNRYPEVKRQVQSKLPDVLALARCNLAI